MSSLRMRDHSLSQQDGGEGSSVAYGQGLVQFVEMGFDGSFGEVEGSGDFLVRFSQGN